MKKNLTITSTFFIAIAFLLTTGFLLKKKTIRVVKINATKMNVLYIGVDNFIEVSVPGLAKENLIITNSRENGMGSSFRIRMEGGYIWNVTKPGKATLFVSEKIGNDTILLDSMQFRAKRIPDPVAYVGGKGDCEVELLQMKSEVGVFSKMENFDFDCVFKVVSFTFSTIKNGKWNDMKAIGPVFTPDMNYVLSGVNVGDRLFFHDFVVQGPDGTLRKIPGVNVTVK